jgi:hypothetical protein
MGLKTGLSVALARRNQELHVFVPESVSWRNIAIALKMPEGRSFPFRAKKSKRVIAWLQQWPLDLAPHANHFILQGFVLLG